MLTMTDDVRAVLACRSVRDKIAIPRHQELCPVNHLPIISELVRGGFLVWLDRALLDVAAKINSGAMIRVEADIYLLTPKGVALCEQHGIKQR